MENFCSDDCWPPNDCPYVFSSVSELMHVCQLIIAIYCSINDTFFAFGYGSCIKLNDVMLISSQYKQFKVANPDWSSANKIDLSLLVLFVGRERKKWNSTFGIFFLFHQCTMCFIRFMWESANIFVMPILPTIHYYVTILCSEIKVWLFSMSSLLLERLYI